MVIALKLEHLLERLSFGFDSSVLKSFDIAN